MGVLQIQQVDVGQVGALPISVKMTTTDSLATITTAGYLNNQPLLGVNLSAADIMAVFYNAIVSNIGGLQSASFGIFTVAVSNNGSVTLTEWVNPSNVLLPVVSGDFAVFNGTSGQIKDSGSAPSSAAQPFVVMSPGSLTSGHLLQAGNANGTLADSGLVPANLMVLNAPNTLSGTGSIILPKVNGTEAANAVTASGVSGVITTSSLTTAGGANYSITWTNTVMTATSTVLLSIMGGTNTTENITLKCIPGSGTATLIIYNNTAATALNGTIFIGYLLV
jgi:hypothetical protein